MSILKNRKSKQFRFNLRQNELCCDPCHADTVNGGWCRDWGSPGLLCGCALCAGGYGEDPQQKHFICLFSFYILRLKAWNIHVCMITSDTISANFLKNVNLEPLIGPVNVPPMGWSRFREIPELFFIARAPSRIETNPNGSALFLKMWI